MNKKLLLALTFAASSALFPLAASAHSHDYTPPERHRHERSWQEHRKDWKRYDREWREHREDLAWRELQRERRHEWYQWHKEHEQLHHLHLKFGDLDIDI